MTTISPMKHAFTPHDLVRFIYREISPEEETGIRQYISEDKIAADEFQLLMDSVTQLDSVTFEPSETSVRIVLDYSRQHSPEATHV